MILLKTKFYPVDVENGVIYLDPHDKERDLANKWSRGDKPCIGLRGAHLMDKPCYRAFRRVPTVTREQLVRDWDEEVKRSLYLWNAAASSILGIIRDYNPEEALRELKACLKRYRSMAISASYERAISDVKQLIEQQRQAL